MARTMGRDSSVVDESVPRGTTRRVLSYARPYRGTIAVFLVIVTLAALTSVAAPLALKTVVDDGVIPGDRRVVVLTALAVAAIAVAEAVLTLVQRWYSARIGEGLILDLRSQVFRHVQEQPIAFFTRAQTGSLVTRLNTDVIGAQAAFSSVLSGAVSNTISVALVLAAMFALSWQITLVSLLLVPLFVLAARWMGQRLAGLTREQMTMNADMGSRMTERFNVGGAMLVKLFGDPDRESAEYTRRAARVRDLGIALAVNRTFFMAALTLVAALATAIVYGLGGILAINGSLSVGTLLALAALLTRLYGPLTSLSNIRVDVMTALVSFQRIFEVLDLRPAIVERTGAIELPGGSLSVRMRGSPSPTRPPTRFRSARSRARRRGTGRGQVRCCATSTSPSSPASSSRSSARAAPARPL